MSRSVGGGPSFQDVRKVVKKGAKAAGEFVQNRIGGKKSVKLQQVKDAETEVESLKNYLNTKLEQSITTKLSDVASKDTTMKSIVSDMNSNLLDVQSMIRSGDFGEIMEKSGLAEDDLEGLKESLEIRDIRLELGEIMEEPVSFSERVNKKHDFLMKHETLLFKGIIDKPLPPDNFVKGKYSIQIDSERTLQNDILLSKELLQKGKSKLYEKTVDYMCFALKSKKPDIDGLSNKLAKITSDEVSLGKLVKKGGGLDLMVESGLTTDAKTKEEIFNFLSESLTQCLETLDDQLVTLDDQLATLDDPGKEALAESVDALAESVDDALNRLAGSGLKSLEDLPAESGGSASSTSSSDKLFDQTQLDQLGIEYVDLA